MSWSVWFIGGQGVCERHVKGLRNLVETLRAFSLPQEQSFNVNPEGCESCRGVQVLLEIEDKPVP